MYVCVCLRRVLTCIFFINAIKHLLLVAEPTPIVEFAFVQGAAEGLGIEVGLCIQLRIMRSR